jgi:predicted metal-dependent HD superfamily phosphohydrolase
MPADTKVGLKIEAVIPCILFKFIKSYLYSMAENQIALLQEAQAVVTGMLQSKLSKSIKFHTLQHTQEVVAACQLLANELKINEEDRFALLLAAWFHDTGYTSGSSKDHEAYSTQIAADFIHKHAIDAGVQKKVEGCITATKMPQSPESMLEQIICDADLFHLGSNSFEEKSKLLRAELIDFGGNDLSKKDWRKINIRFLERHEYFTSYAKQKLQPVKNEHLAELTEKDEKNHETMKPEKKEKEKDKPKEKAKDTVSSTEVAEAKLKKDKEKEAERSIATVFRVMAQSHTNLSQMADSKANILISVNAIILSVMIGSMFEKLQTDPNLQIPLAIIVLVCMTSIVFGILATRPTVSEGRFTRDDIANKRTNLLFFGNFHNMSLDDYNWGMTEMLGDKGYMNTSMIKDQYFLGVVLAKKYKYLRVAYNIFMYGLIVAMVAFLIAFLMPSATEVYTQG